MGVELRLKQQYKAQDIFLATDVTYSHSLYIHSE